MSVAGTWNVTMDTPLGTQRFTWELASLQGSWQGTMVSRAGTSSLERIAVNGTRVSFTSRVDSPMGAIDLAFEGSTSGDTISGTCRTSFGNSEFSGVRG